LLDIGTGAAELLVLARQRFPDAVQDGVEPAAEMLAKARGAPVHHRVRGAEVVTPGSRSRVTQVMTDVVRAVALRCRRPRPAENLKDLGGRLNGVVATGGSAAQKLFFRSTCTVDVNRVHVTVRNQFGW
jgi:hypothetical protein